MSHKSFWLSLSVSTLALNCAAFPAFAQDEAGATVLETITVEGADRLGSSPESLTRNVTILERKDIERFQATSSSLPELLGKAVPGLGISTGAFTTYGQGLRGRSALVVIDGVPQKLNRDTSRDLFNVDISAIEKIEVVHGGSALYGNGATGGIIYITTLQGGGETRFKSRVETGNSLTNFGGQGANARISQSAQGRVGDTDYAFSASGDINRGLFDANGNRIAPEPSQGDLFDTTSGSLFGRVRHHFDDQSIGASIIVKKIRQDSDYAADVSVARLPPGTVPARAIDGLSLDEQGGLLNVQGTIDYKHEDILGGTLDAQVFARRAESRFYPADARAIRNRAAIIQSYFESDIYGGSFVFNTPLPLNDDVPVTLMWGMDAQLESSVGPADIFDGTDFDRSNGTIFTKTRTTIWTPPFDLDQYSAFAQLEIKPIDRVTVRGGVRQQWANFSVDPYTTIIGDPIAGGELDFSSPLYNIGVNYEFIDGVSFFADFSQSYDLSDIGLQLRQAPRGFNISGSNIKPLSYDNYEVGIRASIGDFTGSAAAFLSKSELGALRTENFILVQDRDPEEIKGIELAANYRFNEQWAAGGTFTYLHGERTTVAGQQIALDGFRIPPVKVSGYVEYLPKEWWTVRLDGVYSGSRDDAFNDGVAFGGRKVDDFAVFNLSNEFKLQGGGKLSVGVDNIFNADDYNVYAQLLRNSNNTSHIKSPGTTFKVAYEVEW
ncbi:TonB-dependent receptor (plasmid) [Agrobacterium tumefaciens]|uniref:TonB-dependent receptor n=1 Tax=Agrobacterium tumefaciens TaxID=358 RepID=UPI001574C78A|nr:TonB-dependent receptor [Agrobacterium tumefaciens]NTA19021.1 TonB-dependent receptor [Agrobacterium tumefaciens]WCK74419.1 TonB-dependent receptor [Agrobacterium tumefaciens]